jgi:hypothetical protein
MSSSVFVCQAIEPFWGGLTLDDDAKNESESPHTRAMRSPMRRIRCMFWQLTSVSRPLLFIINRHGNAKFVCGGQ